MRNESEVHISDVYPDKAQYRPGETVITIIEVSNKSDEDMPAKLQVHFVHLATQTSLSEQTIILKRTIKQTFTVEWVPPSEGSLKGYGVDVYLYDQKEHLLDEASTAFDVAATWTLSPRYGFLSDFSPNERNSSDRLLAMSKFHINAVQFYDWMYRHDTLLPLQEEFTDPSGRRLSLRTVQRKIILAHQYNMAALAYTAIYGASKEFYLRHEDWALYQSTDQPYTFGEDYLYIMNPAVGSPWQTHLLEQFTEVLQDTDFDGIHIDQYGAPRSGFDSAGERVEMAEAFPAFIDAAKETLTKVKSDAGIVFNAVNNWPIQAVAPAKQDIVYIEVWPPNVTYADLGKIIKQGRLLSKGKMVVLAAYIPPSQEISVRLADAVIFANGAFHVEIGELNGMLSDPYFPKHQLMSLRLQNTMRDYYDFVVRYEEVLNDGVRETDINVSLRGIPTADYGKPNTVWVIARERLGYTMINLVNLIGVSASWKDDQGAPPSVLTDITIELSSVSPRSIECIHLASPDFKQGRAVLLDFERTTNSMKFMIPRLDYWDLIVVKTKGGANLG